MVSILTFESLNHGVLAEYENPFLSIFAIEESDKTILRLPSDSFGCLLNLKFLFS